MNYQPLSLLCFLCLFTQISLATTKCADAYTSASYGLSHSKKALKAYNFEHQQYYAGRALEAMEKTRDLVGDCGCDAALDAIADSIENLEKATDPEDWDMGRYFSKRAVADTYAVLENLDVCSSKFQPDNSPGEALEDPSEKSNILSGEELDPEQEELARVLNAEATQKLIRLTQEMQELTALLASENSKVRLDKWPEVTAWTGSLSHQEAIRDHYAKETQKLYQRALETLSASRED